MFHGENEGITVYPVQCVQLQLMLVDLLLYPVSFLIPSDYKINTLDILFKCLDLLFVRN
jgi:hypothetical protein